MDFNRIACTLTTDTLARIVAELSNEDGYTPSLDESIVVRDAENVGRPRVGDEHFNDMVISHRHNLTQQLSQIIRS